MDLSFAREGRSGTGFGAAAVLLAFLLTGCSGGTEPGTAASSSPVTTIGTGAPVAPANAGWATTKPTVLHGYFLTPEEFVTVSQAGRIVTARCMERFGFDYPVPDFATAVQRMQASETESDSRLYGITDRAVAAEYGYAPPPSPPAAAGEGPETESAAYQKVLFAGRLPGTYRGRTPTSIGQIDGVQVPPGGCVGQATFEISGTYDGLGTQLGRQLWIQSNQRARSDPEYRAATADWAACLRNKGYRVTDPLNDDGDIERLTADLGERPPSREEIALALADIDCKEKTDLVRRQNTIDLRYAEDTLEEHQLVLDEERTRLDALLKSATAVVEGTG